MSSITGRRGTAAALAGAILLGGLCQGGCTGVPPARKPAHGGGTAASARAVGVLVPPGKAPRSTAPGVMMAAGTADGRALIRSFIARLQPGAATSFEVKYLFGAGKVPAVIFYAVRPPDGLLFSEAQVTGRHVELVLNGSGEYRCIQRGTGQARWTCRQLTQASAAAQDKTFAIYTAAYWAAYLKKAVRAVGTKVTMSAMRPDAPPTVGKGVQDGAMSCIGFSTAGFGVSTVCAAAPGILGSVFLCRGSISFPMAWYTTSPPASLFRLPPGATVIRLKAGQR